jgi:hypothetical protein
VLQAALDWWDSHLHEFEIDGVRYGTDDGEGWGPPPKSERRTRLGAVTEEGSTFDYVYDFGDNWQHRLVVEKIVTAPPGTIHPACITGPRACPPEDCGGVLGNVDIDLTSPTNRRVTWQTDPSTPNAPIPGLHG